MTTAVATIDTISPRLGTELVPDTCAGSNLRKAELAELGAFPWPAIRQAVATAAAQHCEICGGQGPRWPVEVHERWTYLVDDDTRHVQRLDGFVALCPACHGVKHYGYSQIREERGQLPAGSTRAHLAAVNGWGEATVAAYLAAAFAEHRERSSHSWWWDLRSLAGYGFDKWAQVFAPEQRPTPAYDFEAVRHDPGGAP